MISWRVTVVTCHLICHLQMSTDRRKMQQILHSPFSMSLSLWQPLTNTWNSQDNNDDNDDDDDDDDAEDSAQVFFAQFLFNSTKVDQKAFKAFLVVVVTVPPPPPPLFNYYPIRHCLSLSVFTMLSIFFFFFVPVFVLGFSLSLSSSSSFCMHGTKNLRLLAVQAGKGLRLGPKSLASADPSPYSVPT